MQGVQYHEYGAPNNLGHGANVREQTLTANLRPSHSLLGLLRLCGITSSLLELEQRGTHVL